MHAHDRFLPEWFNRIRSRQLTLPRFQRFVAWGHSQISELLTTVLRGLPSGAALILQVGDDEKFKSRTMVDAPTSGERVIEQLLDGQQRLTALWRSLHDYFPDRTYLIGFETDSNNTNSQLPYVYGQSRWYRQGNRYPMWVDDPEECWNRNRIPIRLLRPGDIKDEIDDWIKRTISKSEQDKLQAFSDLSDTINGMRTTVREFNLPYLALPSKTSREIALDVFIKMNTSSVRLTTYDIVVALVEGETDKSLHNYVENLIEAVPRIADYTDVPNLVLDVVALRQDRVPSQAGYRGVDYAKMMTEWSAVVEGIKGMVQFLEDESIFDAQRLPSYIALPVIAALWEYLPENPDRYGNVLHLLRKYLWRSFLTPRYEWASATHALQDFRAIRDVLQCRKSEKVVPILNTEVFPLPTKEIVLRAGWPKRKTIIGRGLLALQIKCGAMDLAEGGPASVNAITSKDRPREYHHLFPESLLEQAGVPDGRISRAVNCALILWRTNRVISNKDPLTYLKERVKRSTLGEDELRRRLKSHLIPYDELSVGYHGMNVEDKHTKVKADYEEFLTARAMVLAKAAELACEGRPLNMNEIFDE